jgi:predicted outer membrane repeat protein
MLNKRKLAILLLFSIILMSSISLVSATDSNATDIQEAADGVELEQSDLNIAEIQTAGNDEAELTDSNHESILADGAKSFYDLNITINGNNDSLIVLEDDYTYDESTDSSFLGGITINHNVTIDGNGHTISGDSKAAGFYTAHKVLLKNIKFINCGNPNDASSNIDYYGQAVRSRFDIDYGYAPVDVVNCTFDNCQSGEGGAVYGVTARNCTFSNCRAEYGGVSFDTDAYNCRFLNNHARYSGGAMEYGGAYDCYFEGNVAEGTSSGSYKYGGGAMLYGTCSNCTFVSNSGRYGGAFYSSQSYMEIVNCTFKSNSAYQGGAVYVTNNAATIVDCVFQNNKATNYGGAIYSASSTSRTIWCRYSGNTASSSSYANTYKCSAYSPSFAIASPFEVHYPNVAVPINISYSYKYYQYDRVYYFNGLDVTLKIYNYTNYNLIGTEYAVSGSLWNNSLDLGKYSISLSATANGFSVSSSFTYVKMGYPTVINLSSQTLNVSSSVLYVVKGNETYLAATLTDGDGHPLEGKYIKLTRTNYPTKRYQTDENGTAIIPLHTLELPEYEGSTYYLTLQSEQSGLYEASEAVGFNMYIRRANVNIDSIQSADIFFYEKLNITVDITDEFGNFLNNTTVAVSFNGEDKNITTDENGQIIIEIPNMVPDDYMLSITSFQSDSYEEATKNINIHVMKNLNLITSQNVSAFCNEGKIVVKLTDQFGNPLGNSIVYLNLDYLNETLTTNDDGVIEFSLEGLAEGNYTAEIRSSDNETHEHTAVDINVYIYRLNSTLNADNIEFVYGESGILTAYLKDSNGNPIANADVGLDIGSVHETLKTDAQGRADFDLSEKLLPNRFEGSVYFDLTNRYRASSLAVNVTVNKISTMISAPDVTCTYNEDKYLVVTLKDMYGNPLANEDVRVDFGVKKLTGKTDDNGQAKLLIQLAPTSYNAAISFSGNEILMSSSSSANVVVKPMNERVSTYITANDLSIVYNDVGYVTVTLKDSYGNVIEDALITINFNGKNYGYITDANGQVKMPLDLLVPNTYSAKVSFEGDDTYQNASSTVKVVVKKAKPKLSATKKKFKVKSAKKYKVTLKTNKNAAMKKVKVYLKVKGKTYTAKTNSKGQATFKLSKLTKKGTYKAVVTYKGDKCYKKVTKTVKITIK